MFVSFSKFIGKTGLRFKLGMRITKKNWWLFAFVAFFYYSFLLCFYLILFAGWLVYAVVYGIVSLFRKIIKRKKSPSTQTVKSASSPDLAPSDSIRRGDTTFVEKKMIYKKDILAFREKPDYIVYDLETTGLDADKDKIVELSMLKITGGVETDRFSTLVNPGIHIPEDASEINHIYDADVADAPRFDEIADRVVEFIGEGYPLVGHNIDGFDNEFLAAALGLRGLTYTYIDTLPMAKKALPDLSRHKLITLIKHYGLGSKQMHRAMDDVVYNQIIFERLCDEILAKKRQTKAE